MAEFGRLLMWLGGSLLLLGALLTVSGRVPWLGHLPGDIVVKRENFTFFAPIGTMIVLSLLLSLLFNLIGRLLR
ncbi:MAG: DUF2905 domain-containing protein [Caldilineaceae bacterium]|nr:DUF2905 domain-containing protein [Caldilineaceae bacterium]